MNSYKYLYAPIISTITVLFVLIIESYFYKGIFISLMLFAAFMFWFLLIIPAIVFSAKKYWLFISFTILVFIQTYFYIYYSWNPGASYIKIGNTILVENSIPLPEYYQEIIQGIIMYDISLLCAYPIFYWIIYNKEIKY